MSVGHTKSYINEPRIGKVLCAYVKAEKDKAAISNKEICQRLEDQFGVVQTPDNLKNKINRGNFGAQLFVMIMCVLGAEEIDLVEINRLYLSVTKEGLTNLEPTK